MTELKTLKDIFKGNETNKQRMMYDDEYIKDYLKAEAVKWVKEFENNSNRPTIQDWENFFNLTEDDLK